MGENDEAYISIYDNLTHKVVLEKQMIKNSEENTLSYTFASNDTLDIEPDDRGFRYSWDITIKRGTEVDSYYAAFKLPPCVIKRVTRDVQK